MKGVENKWKPGIDILDNEFFAEKNQLVTAQQQVEALTKEENIWKRRAAALRNQS